ncbi:hypothetical protein ACNO8S_11600 [Haloarcula sp. KBTZ06]|uniref:hypothetical protein n=1 Tax=Haloarcula sp. KBTZ06 TaxID=3402682 RepID=UPI003B433A51
MVSRRTLLRAVGVSLPAGLAGCNVLTDSGADEAATPTRTATPTATLSPSTADKPATSTPSAGRTETTTAISSPTETASPAVAEEAGTPVFTPTPNGTVDEFGRAVALSADAAVVLAESDGAYVFEANGGWRPTTVLTPDEEEHFGGYNISAAMVGEEAILGGPGAGSEGGAVYLFARDDDQWRQRHQFVPNEDRDEFGRSVAFDGERVVVGDNNDPTTMRSWSGSAYVFGRDGTDWTQEGALGSDAENLFGTAVTVAGDTVLVGAPYAEQDGQETGAVFVYERADGEWSQQMLLTPDDSVADSLFGQSVALDGDTAVVGAPGDGGGSAYVFERTETEWTQRARLTAADAGSGDDVGWSVAYTGGVAVLGAPKAGASGHAYVFRAADDWTETRRLVPKNPKQDAEFGFAVALHGTTALVGSPAFDGPSPAYLFEL